jgi:hypothetical protein
MTTKTYSDTTGFWHRLIRFQYAVLALAGVAAITAAILSSNPSGDTASQLEASRPIASVSASSTQRHVTFYLVSSQAERDAIIALENLAASDRFANNIPEPNSSYAVIVVRTPQEAAAAELTIYEAAVSLGKEAIVSVEDRTSPR